MNTTTHKRGIHTTASALGFQEENESQLWYE